MIKRLYIHNFRCLENFELPIDGKTSILLIGKNGVGKSTVSFALEVFQSIARGTNRVGQLVKPKDLSRGRADVPIRFEIDVLLEEVLYRYKLALEYPSGFRELRVKSEELAVDKKIIYSRDNAQVYLQKSSEQPANFRIDWHLIALPLIQEQSESDPLSIFKRWLARMLILAPIPSLISGESTRESLEPDRTAQNMAEWFSGLLAHSPASYAIIDNYLKEIFHDFSDIKNPVIGNEARSLSVQFRVGTSKLSLPFGDLSDGEKCFFICALVLAANQAYGPIFCFWDEPDSHLSISEAGQFIISLRRVFESGGQILMTSHNPEAIRRFSHENTLFLYRRSHLEPTQILNVDKLQLNDDLVDSLIRGDIEP